MSNLLYIDIYTNQTPCAFECDIFRDGMACRRAEEQEMDSSEAGSDPAVALAASEAILCSRSEGMRDTSVACVCCALP